ncbi:polysaccharide deacetylase family protein [Haloechinothrix salitolerans]|uniref:Polysaccharide deacetylase family protein n=1 Tax=Haloechinothrix salitolerans TaxID=926830 RepID=A0ABW2C5W0_9PSEU
MATSASRPSPHAQNAVHETAGGEGIIKSPEQVVDVVEAHASHHRIPDRIEWPDANRVAVNLTVDFDAMLLRKLLDEPPMQLGKGEFGGRVGVWRLLELFRRHNVSATFFVPGRICELYPDAVRQAAADGHEVADHMWEHRVPADYEIERAHLVRTADALAATTGIRPIGSRSWHDADLMSELGYLYNSHDAADDRPHFVTTDSGTELVSLPFHYTWDDAMYFNFAWLNTENSAQRMADSDRVLELWWDAFQQQYKVGGYLNLCLHPEFSGRSLRIDMLDELIRRMKSFDGVWFSTCADVARHMLGAGRS